MKNQFQFTLALAIGMLLNLQGAFAQSQCKGCGHATPTEVHSSTKNAVTIAGPPDGKGKPVEYQIFTQSKDGAWKMETSGVVEKPGSNQTFKYYRPAQVLVMVFCETPFGGMVEFSSVKLAVPAVLGPPPVKN